MRSHLILILLFFGNYSFSQFKVLEINENWKFRQEGTDQWMHANVPGTVHTDLLTNEKIIDPFACGAEKELQWIENENWEYTCEFYVSEEQLNHDRHELVFEGLDTYAEVFLNGEQILEANNMFLKYRVDIYNLRRGKNSLKIKFISPINKNKADAEEFVRLPGGSDTSKYPVGPFTRKAAYHFGWDWAPRYVTCGIWKPVYLHSWNDFAVMDVYYKTESINEEKVKISCELLVESVRNQEFEVEVASYTKQKVQVKKGRKTYNFEFEIKNPKLWWPNGSGAQHLYEMILQIRKDNKLISADTQNIGLRTIELVNEADSIGTSFYFKVNSKPIFMKGANYIPQDVFLTRVTNKQYEQLIQKIKNANMNMIRVWGGGVYEKEIFYDLCDQHGILVWQDFMFAGTMYPNLLELSLTIKDEVQQQVKRIRKHPCLALWCGNNEIEVAWHNWGWQKQYNYSVSDSMKLWNNYIYHFENLFPKIIEDLNPEIPYVPTSPQSNWGTKENFNHGSMHYWGVWHGKDAFEEFENNVGRFMVEFGFQSFPSIETLKKVVDEEMLFLESDCMQSRQKSYVGNGLILEQIEKYYHTPKDFYEFVELSQKVQAKALQMAIEAHITNQPHCMGTLLWQLNDCWPGPSWSIIDFYGEEKEGYRVVKECFKK